MANVVNIVTCVMVIFILPTVYTSPLVPVPLLDQESAPLVAKLDMTKIKSYIDNEVKNEIKSLRQLEFSEVDKDINTLKHDVKSLQTDLKDMQNVMKDPFVREKIVKDECTEMTCSTFDRNPVYSWTGEGAEGQTTRVVTVCPKVQTNYTCCVDSGKTQCMQFQANAATKKGKLHIRDCSNLKGKVVTSGVYRVYPEGPPGLEVYCDMETDGGGWTVFQRRINGSVDFYRNWADYERGFGDIRAEFWLGNSKLHKLTSQGNYELRVDLEDFDGNIAYAYYSTFSIGDNTTNYKLNVGGYSGTAGDSLAYHKGRPFSTYDRDNDSSKSNCADVYKGAWWYNNCQRSNLNGLYLGNKVGAKGMYWYHWKNNQQSMKTASMMFRRKE